MPDLPVCRRCGSDADEMISGETHCYNRNCAFGKIVFTRAEWVALNSAKTVSDPDHVQNMAVPDLAKERMELKAFADSLSKNPDLADFAQRAVGVFACDGSNV